MALALLGSVGMPSAARAADPDAASAMADTLFREGRRQMKAGHFDAACKYFTDSLRLERTAGTSVNLGQCEEKRGRLAHALFAFRDSYDMMETSDDRKAYAAEKIAELNIKVARVVLKRQFPEDVHAALSHDGVDLPEALLGVELPVDAGSHTVTVVAKGHKPNEIEYKVVDGQKLIVQLAVGAPLALTGKTTPNAVQEPSRAWSYGLGGTGLGLLLAGGISGIFLLDAASTFKDNCNTDTRVCRNQDGEDARSRANTLQWVTPILLGAGLAATTAAIVVWPRSAATPAAPKAELWFNPAGGQLGVRGSF